MKHVSHVKTILCLIIVVPLFGCATGQAAHRLEKRSEHPYLLYTDENIARLKERIENEPIIAEAWQRILANADAALAPAQETEEEVGQGRRRGRRRRGGGDRRVTSRLPDDR